MPSVRKNAIYSVFYQVIRLIFPIITYPYVSRILGPEGLGSVSYAQTLANNFVTFGLLGIPIYAAREISKSREDTTVLQSTFSEIMTLSFICSILATGGYFLLGLINRGMMSWLFILFGVDVCFSWLRLDWLYQGMEEFRYITIRNLILRIASLFVMFLIIKNQEHYFRYGVLWVSSGFLSGLINFGFSYKYVHFSCNIKVKNLWKHLKNSLGSTLILISSFLYSSVDVLMLGGLLDDGKVSVGYYSVAARLTRIIISIVVAVNGVVMVRIANRKMKGKETEVIGYIKKNIDYVLFLAIPSMLGIFIIAKDFILVFAGNQFIPSAKTLRILCLEIIFIAISGVIQNQILFAQGKERVIVKILSVSLIIALVLNAVLIPRFTHVGAAYATLITRIIEMGLCIWFGRHQFFMAFNKKAFIMLIPVICIWFGLTFAAYSAGLMYLPVLVRLLVTLGFSFTAYISLCAIFRIEQFVNIAGALRKNITRKKSKTDEKES